MATSISFGSTSINVLAQSTYYVDPAGNDAAAGNGKDDDNPLKTPQAALGFAPSGSAILLEQGTYTGAVNFTRSNVILAGAIPNKANAANTIINGAVTGTFGGEKIASLSISGALTLTNNGLLGQHLGNVSVSGATVQTGSYFSEYQDCKFNALTLGGTGARYVYGSQIAGGLTINSGPSVAYLENCTVNGNITVSGSSGLVVLNGITGDGTGTITIPANRVYSFKNVSGFQYNIHASAIDIVSYLKAAGATEAVAMSLAESVSSAVSVGHLSVNGKLSLGFAQKTDYTANTTLTAVEIDRASTIQFNQTTWGISVTLPDPTITTKGDLKVIHNVGTADLRVNGDDVRAGSMSLFVWMPTTKWKRIGNDFRNIQLTVSKTQDVSSFPVPAPTNGDIFIVSNAANIDTVSYGSLSVQNNDLIRYDGGTSWTKVKTVSQDTTDGEYQIFNKSDLSIYYWSSIANAWTRLGVPTLPTFVATGTGNAGDGIQFNVDGTVSVVSPGTVSTVAKLTMGVDLSQRIPTNSIVEGTRLVTAWATGIGSGEYRFGIVTESGGVLSIGSQTVVTVNPFYGKIVSVTGGFLAVSTTSTTIRFQYYTWNGTAYTLTNTQTVSASGIQTGSIDVVGLPNGAALVAYFAGGTTTFYQLSVSGGLITIGSASTAASGFMGKLAVSGSAEATYAFQPATGNFSYRKITLGSSNALTIGAQTQLYNANIGSSGVTGHGVSGMSVFVIEQGANDSIVCTLSGTTANNTTISSTTYGTSVRFTLKDAMTGFITYQNDISARVFQAPVIISGSALTIGSSVAVGDRISVTYADEGQFLNNQVIQSWSGIRSGSSFHRPEVVLSGYVANTNLKVHGVAQNAFVHAGSVQVALPGTRSTAHSGLVPGAEYYFAGSRLTTSVTSYRAGLATSTTDVLLDNFYPEQAIPTSTPYDGLRVTNWAQANAYAASEIVQYNSMLYQANGAIPAGTALTIGTTGATWKSLGVQARAQVNTDDRTGNRALNASWVTLTTLTVTAGESGVYDLYAKIPYFLVNNQVINIRVEQNGAAIGADFVSDYRWSNTANDVTQVTLDAIIMRHDLTLNAGDVIRIRANAAFPGGTSNGATIINSADNFARLSIRKVAGFLPVTVTPKNHLLAKRATSTQGGVAVGTVIIFNAVQDQFGASIDTSTGVITLPASDKKYLVEWAVALFGGTGSGATYCNTRLYNTSTNGVVSYVDSVVKSASNTDNYSSQPIGKALLTVSSPTTFSVRAYGVGTTAPIISFEGTYLMITQID